MCSTQIYEIEVYLVVKLLYKSLKLMIYQKLKFKL
jgi:hypothetical protein